MRSGAGSSHAEQHEHGGRRLLQAGVAELHTVLPSEFGQGNERSPSLHRAPLTREQAASAFPAIETPQYLSDSSVSLSHENALHAVWIEAILSGKLRPAVTPPSASRPASSSRDTSSPRPRGCSLLPRKAPAPIVVLLFRRLRPLLFRTNDLILNAKRRASAELRYIARSSR